MKPVSVPKFEQSTHTLASMDIFDNRVWRKNDGSAYSKGQEPSYEMSIRMVLPAEQTVAIARGMLERQSKPEGTGVVDWEILKMKSVSKPRKRAGNRGKVNKEASTQTKRPRRTSDVKIEATEQTPI